MDFLFPDREKAACQSPESALLSRSGNEAIFMHENLLEDAASYSRRFGAMIRREREAHGLRLEDLSAATGVGIRFLHDLETGKPTCQIGRSLVVAAAIGLDAIKLLELASEPHDGQGSSR
ncbi:helix-turn-helix domain-containing protein [Sphingobium yanoikuyae]|uniref:helix-turn-helix domain-containing protein n=1 Tax=Sphingobium yanoikuyae TaxID=13690 RepID=UPI0030B8ADAF